eukprot:s862_g8.t1
MTSPLLGASQCGRRGIKRIRLQLCVSPEKKSIFRRCKPLCTLRRCCGLSERDACNLQGRRRREGIAGGFWKQLCWPLLSWLGLSRHQTFSSEPRMAFEVVFGEKVKKLGFELGLEEDDRPHVSGVKPGGAAIALGVRAGDILVTINGAPVGKPSREEIKALLKVRPLTLQLERISSGGAAGAEVSDSGSESDGQVRSSPKEARLNADMALLCAAKAKPSSSASGKAQMLNIRGDM